MASSANRTSRRPPALSFVPLLLFLLVGLLGAGAETDPQGLKPIPAPLAGEFEKVGKLLQNAIVKLRRNVVRYGGATGTPAQRCCSGNLTRLARRIETVDEILHAFRECYDRTENDQMVAATEFVRRDLQAVVRAVRSFERAATRDDALAEVENLKRTFFDLDRSVREMLPCEGVAPVSEPDDASPAERETPGGP